MKIKNREIKQNMQRGTDTKSCSPPHTKCTIERDGGKNLVVTLNVEISNLISFNAVAS